MSPRVRWPDRRNGSSSSLALRLVQKSSASSRQKALDWFKQRIRESTRKAKGVSIQTTMEELASDMRGWRRYFGFLRNARSQLLSPAGSGCDSGPPSGGSGKTPRRRRAELIALTERLANNTADTGRGPWASSTEQKPSLWGFPTRTSDRSI